MIKNLPYIDKYSPERAVVFNDELFERVLIARTAVHFLYHFSGFPVRE